MWHQLWIPVLIPTLIIKSNCDVNKTDSNTDIFIKYGHAEANYDNEKVTKIVETTVEDITPTVTFITTVASTTQRVTTRQFEEATEDVMFIPNSREPIRRDDDDYLDDRGVKIKDIMMMRTVGDAVNKKIKPEDKPHEDIVFISGKNHDYVKPDENLRRNFDNSNMDLGYNKPIEDTITPKPKLNCSHLDCNNAIQSICGTKYVGREWKYRLFLNECYFRKVNCGFSHEVNRYQQVAIDKCRKIGSHIEGRPFSFRPKTFEDPKTENGPEIARRKGTISRRSMTMTLNGQFCSHPCPVACPDDYDPACAVSATGHRRVFLNHCKLDLNSCLYSVVWHARPLAECVGGKKADMRQNRGFIDWMHRVGIVDKKGRLLLE